MAIHLIESTQQMDIQTVALIQIIIIHTSILIRIQTTIH